MYVCVCVYVYVCMYTYIHIYTLTITSSLHSGQLVVLTNLSQSCG